MIISFSPADDYRNEIPTPFSEHYGNRSDTAIDGALFQCFPILRKTAAIECTYGSGIQIGPR